MRPSSFAMRRCGLLLLLAGLGLGGCTTVYDVKVDAMQNPELESGYAYRVVPKDPARAEADPNYEKTVRMVRNALSGRGMFEAETPEQAEVVVEIDYGVGPPRGVVQVQDATDDTFITDAWGRPRRLASTRAGTMADGRPLVTTYEVYEKKLTIVAREAQPADDKGEPRPARELWRVEARVEDRKETVDAALPVLVGAAADHIGRDSETQQRRRMTEKSEPVTFVKGET